MVDIRKAQPSDASAWLEMRGTLWPDHEDQWHAKEIEQYFAGTLMMPLEVLVACDEDRPVGFVELNIRAYAEGCVSDRVGFLEGWYVRPEVRRRGVGAALLRAAEQWAIQQGCTEFASDAELDNVVSEQAHRALGFEEVVQIRCFKKELA